MFGIMGFLDSYAVPNEMLRKSAQESKERELAKAIPWDPNGKWQKYQAYTAESFQAWEPKIFHDLEPTRLVYPDRILKEDPKHFIMSDDGLWFACRKILPRASRLSVFKDNNGHIKGSVMFDGDLPITNLHYRNKPDSEWFPEPMMSFTPMEVRSLNLGTRLAKGHVIIGGLGLGYQLVEVSKRRQVRKITLIERSQSVINLIWPRVKPLIANGHEIEIITGDVFEKLPQMSADVALIDTFPSFPGNDYERNKMRRACPNIQTIWCWGGGAAV